MTSEELRKSFGYLFENELPFLKHLVSSLPENPVIINIGAGAGTSGLAILEARPDSFLYTIDITKEDSPFGCLVAEENVLEDAGLWNQNRNKQFHGDSKIIAIQWYNLVNAKHRVVDMVFVDGDHSYYGASRDIELWSRHIKKGGIVAVHDYNKTMVSSLSDGPHLRSWDGVNAAVDNCLKNHPGTFNRINKVDSLIAFGIENKIENPIHRKDRSVIEYNHRCLECGEIVDINDENQCEIT